MKCRGMTALLAAALICMTGCSADQQSSVKEPDQTAAQTEPTTEPTAASTTEATTTETTAPPPEPYRFDPHVYSPKLAPEIPQKNWEAFYNLCDALRAGEFTFACADREAYDWATDPAVLGHLFPPACMKITGESNDGTVPFENGVGRIYYNIPPGEYTQRQAEFEETVTGVLNSVLEPDDDDFEKCLKLYDYMESNFTYELYPEGSTDGAHYYTLMNHRGVCDELSGVYVYYLLQAGVDAVQLGCFEPEMCHSWVYVILNGKGYHVDPTWALKDSLETQKLRLEYFMMTDARRTETGCPVTDLTAALLPCFWVNRSSLTFPADDDRYYMKDYSDFDSLDEQNKTVHYTDMYGESHEMCYG